MWSLTSIPSTYARLAPESINDKALQADGEGSLASKTASKHSDADFALWKASKAGEPSWPSTWGAGRPGWRMYSCHTNSYQFHDVLLQFWNDILTIRRH